MADQIDSEKKIYLPTGLHQTIGPANADRANGYEGETGVLASQQNLNSFGTSHYHATLNSH